MSFETEELNAELCSAIAEFSFLSSSFRRQRRAINDTSIPETGDTSQEPGLGGLCASPFWDDHLSWPDEEFPDFTNCFLRSVLVWIPVLLLWLWAPFYLWRLWRLDGDYISSSLLHRSKVTAWIFLLMAQLADLLLSIYLRVNDHPVPGVEFLAPIALLITYSLVGVVMYVEKNRGVRSSIPLFSFFLLHVVFSVPSLQHDVRFLIRPYDLGVHLPRVVIFFVNLIFVFVQLVNYCLVEPAPLFDSKQRRSSYADDAELSVCKPCPEKIASPSSYLTFWWLTDLIWSGYRNPLELKNVWLLKSDLRSSKTSREFSYRWDRELGKDSTVENGQSTVTNGKLSHNGDVRMEESLEVTPFRSGETDVKIVKAVETSERLSREPSFLRALILAFWRPFFISALLNLLALTLQLLSPVVLARLIKFANLMGTTRAEPLWKGYSYAFGLFLLEVGRALIHQHHFYFCFILGIKLRTAIMTAVYLKSLRLTSLAKQASTVGEVVNIMAVDAQKFMEITGTLNLLWSAPLMIFIAMWMLWGNLGPSAMAGLAVMCALIPFNLFIGAVTRKLQMANMKFKDGRIKLMNEVLNGIKVLKLYAWEPSFIDKLTSIRASEMKVLRKQLYLFAGIHFSFSCAPVFVAVAAFAAFILSDPKNNILTAEKAFVSLSLFNIIRFPMNMLPHMISFLVQISVSIKRISAFLKREEIPEGRISRTLPPGLAVRVRGGIFSWKRKDETPTLSDLNFDVATGSLTAVVGTVGSGKSSLISALLGEMEIPVGEVSVEKDAAYVPQQAWMQNATLKENILFGKEDSGSYHDVVAACALEPDLKVLPGGDSTEIGEKGINLSGGQKQRISLARAVYQNASLYLLDDPLSAVDSHVGKHIFEKVLGPNGLLRKKTRILVTNMVTYLPQADQIILLKDGVISEVGTFKDLMTKGGIFADFINTHATKDSEKEEDNILDEEEKDETNAEDERQSPNRPIEKRRVSSVKKTAPTTATVTVKNRDDKGAKLTTEEGVEKGRVKKEVMLAYLQSVGWFFTILTLLMFLAQNGFMFYSSVWLKDWADGALPKTATSSVNNFTAINYTAEEKPENETIGVMEEAAFSSEVYLGVYALLGVAQGITIMMSSVAIAIGCVRACISLHSLMLRNVLAAPMSFFDTVPLGRILNRFSKDIDAVDLQLPNNMRFVLMTASRVITTLLTIAYVTPAFMITVPGLAILYFFIQRVYVATTRQLKRLDSASRSPIYSFFGESIQGAPTIRAFNRRDTFERECLRRIDKNLMFFFPSTVADRWVGLRLEMVGALVVMFASLFAIHSKGITAGAVGLSITYAMQVTQTLNFMVRMSTEFETNVVAVERIKEYSETPTEAPWNATDSHSRNVDDEKSALVPKRKTPSADWPQEGRIEMKDYSLRYREGLDLVLKDISLVVESGQKVGIVGRTGAGKSSLTLALFRIIEPAGGKIVIDGENIVEMGLHDLRRKISIIPQDPVVFSGTLRLNLDPFQTADDDELWKALELAHLKDFVAGLEQKLDYPCTEGGDNLSVGQRQLVCLARALLRKSRILVLDEATAAVDLETDALLQNTIRREFAKATIITIAHRLNTILDYDKILVLDKGRVAEYDTPTALLANNKSTFHSMAKDANLL